MLKKEASGWLFLRSIKEYLIAGTGNIKMKLKDRPDFAAAATVEENEKRKKSFSNFLLFKFFLSIT